MAQIVIHYDVPVHSISLETFIQSAISAQKTARGFADHYFSKNYELEISVLPPEHGSFLQPLGIKLKTIKDAAVLLAALAAFDATPMGQGIVTELTGKSLTEWSVDAIRTGKFVAAGGWESAEEFVEELISRLEVLLAQMVGEYLEGSEFVFEELPEDIAYLISEAKSSLFAQLLNEKKVEAVGFSRKEHFPIPRSEFAVRAVRSKKPEEEIDENWDVEVVPIVVTALAFKETANKVGRWRGTLSNKKEIDFTIDDQYFWKMVHSKKIKFVDGTVLKVQIATRIENNRSKEKRVLRVLSVADEELAGPLAEDALDVILGEWSYAKPKSTNQGELF